MKGRTDIQMKLSKEQKISELRNTLERIRHYLELINDGQNIYIPILFRLN